jgi:hypothetical protein
MSCCVSFFSWELLQIKNKNMQKKESKKTQLAHRIDQSGIHAALSNLEEELRNYEAMTEVRKVNYLIHMERMQLERSINQLKYALLDFIEYSHEWEARE